MREYLFVVGGEVEEKFDGEMEMDGGEGWAMMGWLGHGLIVRSDRVRLVYYD